MNFSAINIQGNILSSDILGKVRSEDIRHQTAADFKLDKHTSVRDEIGVAWGAARAHWKAFQFRRERLKDTDSGTSETRQSWIIPFLRELAYDLDKSNAELINNKTYAISHRAASQGGFPVHIVGINQSLDRRAESGGARLSPHALVQEYLNNTEHLYAIVTNGRFLRLLRDATRLSRLSYLEFDLQRMMEEELFAEFALLFRVLHATRMPLKKEEGENAIIEYYHQEALASGSRIRERLSLAVEESLKILANGLLKHPENHELREQISNGNLSASDYYLYLLRLVYRTLFLLVIEERHLIYPEERDEELDKKRNIYYQYYSINRLTKLVEKRIYVDPRKTDLWRSIMVTFRIFENGQLSAKLGIQPLGSGLFSPAALGTLANQMLDNQNLLRVLQHLVTFENEQGQRVRVNYADLDVEEFGSVYEGLLEYAPELREISGQWTFSFVSGTERSSSGSHYTPEELVKPLIDHSLNHLIEDRLKEADPEKALLSLKVADVACGSGHILLSAARRIGVELARVRTGEDQPTPTALRQAIRDVIGHCIYGVDKNPMAVELCKVALWLEAHNPGQPLNFLDHKIKCGNAIVGLSHKEELLNGIASDAFKKVSDDTSAIASEFRKRNEQERKSRTQLQLDFSQSELQEPLSILLQKYEEVMQMPERTPEQIAAKEKAYETLTKGSQLWRLKTLADLQVAQFFIPKKRENRPVLVTDGEYMAMLRGKRNPQAEGMAMCLAEEQKFFHYFLEFPEVFIEGGFSCILGNPPYLGDRKLKDAFGEAFLEWIRSNFTNGATIDLVGYFFLRINDILQSNGFQSLISTNTITQGKARDEGLEKILLNGSTINHAIKLMKWPGLAAIEVCLVTIFKGKWHGQYILHQKSVKQITSYLDDSESLGQPIKLNRNENISYQGSIILGSGFILEPEEAEKLIQKDQKNKKVLFPYLNGHDLNSRPDQNPSRWVINFFNWPLRRMTNDEWNELSKKERERIIGRLEEEKVEPFAPPNYDAPVATDYPDCFRIVEATVKPERTRWKTNKKGKEIIGTYALRKPLPNLWWIYGEKRPALYKSISHLKRVLVINRHTKNVVCDFVSNQCVYSEATVIFSCHESKYLLILNSTIHDIWSWKNCSTMGAGTLRYSPTDGFQTFPFPKSLNDEEKYELENLGDIYHTFRKELMLKMQEGLTTTYNRFHDPSESNLDHIRLRELHQQMDEAVLRAFGWEDLIEKEYPASDDKFRGTSLHGFYEVDYLPENDRIRFTLHPTARKEVLKRLLLLNHQIYEQEIRQGQHKKEDAEAFYLQKGQIMPKEVAILYAKGRKVHINEQIYTKELGTKKQKMQIELKFEPFTDFKMKEFGLNDGIYSIRDTVKITRFSTDKVNRWFKELADARYEGVSAFDPTDIERSRISFHGLIELVVIGTLREYFTLNKILTARKELGEKTGKVFPFATNNVKERLKVAGKTLQFILVNGDIVNLDGSSQLNVSFITQFFRDIEFDTDGVAQRLIPKKGNSYIIIDPKVGGGKPSFKNHSGIQVETILKFYQGPGTESELMQNYGISKVEIEAAISYVS